MKIQWALLLVGIYLMVVYSVAGDVDWTPIDTGNPDLAIEYSVKTTVAYKDIGNTVINVRGHNRSEGKVTINFRVDYESAPNKDAQWSQASGYGTLSLIDHKTHEMLKPLYLTTIHVRNVSIYIIDVQTVK